MAAKSTGPVVSISRDGTALTVSLKGRLDADSAAAVWAQTKSLDRATGVTVDASGLEYCDGAGVAVLFALERRANARIHGLAPEFRKLMAPFEDSQMPGRYELPPEPPPVVAVGRAGAEILSDLRDQIAFTGQLAAVLAGAVVRPDRVRWREMWATFEKAGVNALVIVGMISFLTGLIMAFQAVAPLQQFGVDIFVVNLVALAMTRELGVLMTAIVLAGRSGSAFAAEIGTMKVNEEVDALTTMGLDPVRFLVAPKVIAGILVMPVLTVYANLMGVAGGLLVAMLIGHPWAAVYGQLVAAVGVTDVAVGLIKAFVFGFLVSGIGCLRGLQTGSGATAVGDATTRAVVTGIVLIVVTDAVFAVVFYAVGW